MAICRRHFNLGLVAGGAARAVSALVPRPKLLVLVVLEQIRQDYWDSAEGQFGVNGLRRLLLKGSHFPDCRHLASTFPASTLATLATGAWPAEHGIVADTWFDGAAKSVTSASQEALLATTLMAQVAGERQTRTFVISLDAPHAGLVAGASAARQFWMDASGSFTTLGEAPVWLDEFNRLKPLDNARNTLWMAVDAKTGAPPLRTLTYDEAHPEQFVELYKGSHLGQGAQFELLAHMIDKERLGQQESFDFVCLVTSSSSRLGYETGGRSPLMRQMTLQLDVQLGFLLNRLKSGPGDNGYNLVLAGGHGAPPAPPAESRARMAVPGEAVAQLVNKALDEHSLGNVSRYVYPFLYLDTSGFRDPEPVRQAAGRAAMEHPAVAGFYTAGGYCSTNDGWRDRFRNSFHPTRSGDVMLAYRPEYVEDYAQGRGISYGSLYNYDVRVPLLFYGPQFVQGVFEAPVQSVDVAPTLARAMGVPSPSSSDGRVLGEAFNE
ncbi:MAG: alkaline phosphatase family protein [Candidatus Solibacter sp.]